MESISVKTDLDMEKDQLRVVTSNNGGDNASPPSLAPLTISGSSSSTSETNYPCWTPRNQPIMTVDQREDNAKEYVDSLGLDWSLLSTSQQVRAKKIQSPDFTWSPSRGDPPNTRYTTNFQKEWNHFVEALSVDELRGAFSTCDHVFFNEEMISKSMAIRRQLSGSCCMHAAVLFQHYVQTCRRGPHKEHHRMLDASSFIRMGLPENCQRSYIEKGVIHGQTAKALIKRITGTDDCDYYPRSIYPKLISPDIHREDTKSLYTAFRRLEEPGLVCGFMVDTKFTKNTVLEGCLDRDDYDSTVKKRNGKAYLHAMVLVGAYHSISDDRYWFLLQNTHKDQYFKLMDGEYLASCMPTIWFAHKHADMSLVGDLAVVEGEYSETASFMEMEECGEVGDTEE